MMRNLMAGMAFAALVGLAGCAAPAEEPGAPESEAPAPEVSAEAEGVVFETPYYTITLPEEYRDQVEFAYNDEFKMTDPELGIGYDTVVRPKGEAMPLFSVICFTDPWGTQGVFWTQELGKPSNLEGCHVLLVQGREDADGEQLEDRTAEFAPCVVLK